MGVTFGTGKSPALGWGSVTSFCPVGAGGLCPSSSAASSPVCQPRGFPAQLWGFAHLPAVVAACELGSVPGVNDLPGAGGCSELWGGCGVAVGLRRDPGAPETSPSGTRGFKPGGNSRLTTTSEPLGVDGCPERAHKCFRATLLANGQPAPGRAAPRGCLRCLGAGPCALLLPPLPAWFLARRRLAQPVPRPRVSRVTFSTAGRFLGSASLAAQPRAGSHPRASPG